MNKPLKAVHDDSLVEYLESLGVRSRVEAGREKCAFCGDVITYDSLHALFPDSGQIKFACSKADCVKALLAKMEGVR